MAVELGAAVWKVEIGASRDLWLSQAQGSAYRVRLRGFVLHWGSGEGLSVQVRGDYSTGGRGMYVSLGPQMRRSPEDLEATNPGLTEVLKRLAPQAPWL